MTQRITGRTGPFITWVTEVGESAASHRRPHLLRTSRRHRKGLPPLSVPATSTHPLDAAGAVKPVWTRLWAPGKSQWWIAILFMIGASHFSIAAARDAWPALSIVGWISADLIGWIYFVGSIFFTSAAYLQWLEALNNDIAVHHGDHVSWTRGWRLFGWRPRNLGYQASAVQLIGTLLFNVNTADALIPALGQAGENYLVWTPNMLGSVCFLVASQLAIMEISHRAISFQPRSVSWWITIINMLGSIFFMISAVLSWTARDGDLIAPYLADLGTFAGGVCFLVAAYLLIPEMFEKPST